MTPPERRGHREPGLSAWHRDRQEPPRPAWTPRVATCDVQRDPMGRSLEYPSTPSALKADQGGRAGERDAPLLASVVTRPMRVTIIDRSRLLADSLALVLEREGYLVTTIDIGHAESSSAKVLAAGLRSAGRLVFLDHHLGSAGDGVRLVGPLTAAGASVVVLTETTDRPRWGRAVGNGAKGVLPKTCALTGVLQTARRVRDGLPLMSSTHRAALIASADAEREELRVIRTQLDRLTRREVQILRALMTGATVNQIARSDVVAIGTVRSQVKSILSKLDTNSQVGAVSAAYRVSWHPPRS